jgi:hypothetical protein
MELGAQNENSMVSHEGGTVIIDKNVALNHVNNCFHEEGIYGTHAGETTVY